MSKDDAEVVNAHLKTAKFDGVCDIHDCDNASSHAWHGVSRENNDESVYVYVAEYCNSHSQSHAEIDPNKFHIGSITVASDEGALVGKLQEETNG